MWHVGMWLCGKPNNFYRFFVNQWKQQPQQQAHIKYDCRVHIWSVYVCIKRTNETNKVNVNVSIEWFKMPQAVSNWSLSKTEIVFSLTWANCVRSVQLHGIYNMKTIELNRMHTNLCTCITQRLIDFFQIIIYSRTNVYFVLWIGLNPAAGKHSLVSHCYCVWRIDYYSLCIWYWN